MKENKKKIKKQCTNPLWGLKNSLGLRLIQCLAKSVEHRLLIDFLSKRKSSFTRKFGLVLEVTVWVAYYYLLCLLFSLSYWWNVAWIRL